MGRKRKKLPMEEIKELYRKGYTLREIADIYGVSRQTILRRFKEDRFPTRKLMYGYFKDEKKL